MDNHCRTRITQTSNPQLLLVLKGSNRKGKLPVTVIPTASATTVEITRSESLEQPASTSPLSTSSSLQLSLSSYTMSGANTSGPVSIPGFKVPKPKAFDGLNVSLNAVNEWIHSVDEYVDLSGI